MNNRSLRCEAWFVVLCLSAAVPACSGELEQHETAEGEGNGPGEVESIDLLTASQSDLDVRIYDDTLTHYLAALNPSGLQNGWLWSVRDPRVTITTSGARFTGTLVARRSTVLHPIDFPTFPVNIGNTPLFPRTVLTTPIFTVPFDRALTLTHVAGQLRLSVNSSPVVLTRISQGLAQTLVSVDLSPLYRTSLPIINMPLVAGSTTLDIDASIVDVSYQSGYAQVLATFNVN